MQIDIEPVAFRAWLQEGAEHLVGWTCNEKLSPISAWLRERYQKEFFVTDESIVMGFFEACIATPQWASQFVRALDAGRNGEEEPIMGGVALSVFDEICQEEVGAVSGNLSTERVIDTTYPIEEKEVCNGREKATWA